jgi:hypothetical protein
MSYDTAEKRAEYQRRWYQKNHEAHKARAATRRKGLSQEERLISNARDRVGYDKVLLVPADIRIPEFCPVLGIPLKPGKGQATANSPSLDRIDPNGGYTRENTHVISHRANMIKNNATPDELAKVALFFAPHLVAPVS